MAESFPLRFGRYELRERLAVGGMAEVFSATVDGEHGFARQVVIKRLLPHLAVEPAYTAMFIDEAKLTARLVHPKIAQTYELGRVGEQLFIAMEMIDGVDVLAMLRELAHRRERMAPDLAVWIAHEVLDALEFAHHLAGPDGRPLGVVHRDISPSNILLSRRGDVKLVDFGIAHAAEPGRHHRTKSGTLKGKYGYMSPEQVLEQVVDGRSDLFSVGIVLAEMLCGRRLFAAPAELDVLLMVRDARLGRLDEFGKHIDRTLDTILRKALRKEPADRWSSAGDMRDALDDWLFQQRIRITPKRMADAVESVYEPVWTRRRAAQLEGAPAEPPSVVEDAPPMPAPPTRAPTSAEGPRAIRTESAQQTVDDMRRRRLPTSDDSDGIPRGLDLTLDSMPIVTIEEPPAPPARLVVKIPPLTERELEHRTHPPTARPRPAPPPPPRRVPPPPPPPPVDGDDDLELAFAGLEVPEVELPRDDDAPTDERPAVSARSLADAALEVPVATVGDQPSVRYTSIEAAVSALSLNEPDPSTIEFDGGPVGQRRPSTAELQLTAEELQQATDKPPPALAEIEDTPEENGDFSVTPPLRVLYRVLSGRQTGLLVATVGAIKKEIYVRDGMPEYVSSNVSSELFGNWLVQQGVLSQGELAMALAMMPHYGGKLGDTLVGLGLLKPLEVFRHLTRQVRSKLIDVCTWGRGFYSWYENRSNEREAFPLDLNAFEVLGAGAMAIPPAVVDAWVERWGGARLRATKGKFGPDRFELQGLRSLYDILDGRKRVSEVLARWTDEAERRDAARMLMLLEFCELARTA